MMKNKLSNFLKENRWLIITFLLSSIIISVIYTFNKIAPFGNNSMLDVDFYHQYGPLLNELYDRVKEGESLLYSFNTGGGIPFYRNFLNYLSSPFNIIMFLFKKENIVMAFSVIIALKAIFASCTMAYYLKKTFKKSNFAICAFGALYAFSGYFCAYYWNIMWLDGMVFLPLIAYGINRIIDEKKPLFYTISLAIMLFANYFIGYMICIFSVFYFIGYFLYKGNYKIKNILKTFLMFGLFSVLAAGLVSFALVPLFYSLQSISATKGSFPDVATNFGVIDYLFNHLTATNRTVFASDILPLPNVYCGLISLCLIILLFINKKINLKAKVLTLLSLLFFFFSFNINTIDFIWHAFHVPNDLPWRYSFIYVFVLIVISYYSFLNIKYLSKLKVTLGFMIMFVFTMLASKLSFENMSESKVIACLIFILCYYFIYLLSFLKKMPKRVLMIFTLVTVSCECIYGINANWKIDHDIDNFMMDKKPYENLITYAKETDGDLYRMEKTNYLTLNDPAWYGYKGISTFSSMAYESVSKFQRMMGMPGNDINSYYYNAVQTPVYNTMFNVKYLMGNYVDDDYYDLEYSDEYYDLNKYRYSSSIAYAVDKSVKNWELITGVPFINQSNFVLLSTGYNNIFTPVKVSSVSGGYIVDENFEMNSNGEFTYNLNGGSTSLKLSLKNDKAQSIYIYIGGSSVTGFYVDGTYYSLTSDEYYVVNVGKKSEGLIDVEINFDSSEEGVLSFYAYSVNHSIFEKFYEEIKDGCLKISDYNDTNIVGELTAKKNQIVFTSIAYDKGWSVYIDGKKVKTYMIADSYLGFDITEGTHNIKMVFYPYKLKEGIIISIVSFTLLMVYCFCNNKRVFKKSRKR